MRVKTLQIVWHDKEPISTVDFSKSGILATGGADKTIKVRVSVLFLSLESKVSTEIRSRRPLAAPLGQFWEVRQGLSTGIGSWDERGI